MIDQPAINGTYINCMNPVEHPRFCMCKKANEKLIKERDELRSRLDELLSQNERLYDEIADAKHEISRAWRSVSK